MRSNVGYKCGMSHRIAWAPSVEMVYSRCIYERVLRIEEVLIYMWASNCCKCPKYCGSLFCFEHICSRDFAELHESSLFAGLIYAVLFI